MLAAMLLPPIDIFIPRFYSIRATRCWDNLTRVARIYANWRRRAKNQVVMHP